MTDEEREAYYQSDEWKARRDECLDLAFHVCYLCRGLAEQAHHLTYERLGNERQEDLMALCRRCHEAVHGYGVLGICHGEPELLPDCPCPQCRYDEEMADAEERIRKRYSRRMRKMLVARRDSDLMHAEIEKHL